MDVGPHVWAKTSDLSTIYVDQVGTTLCLDASSSGLVTRGLEAGGTFVQPNNIEFSGTFSPWSGAGSNTPVVTSYLIEMLYQHVYAYFPRRTHAC